MILVENVKQFWRRIRWWWKVPTLLVIAIVLFESITVAGVLANRYIIELIQGPRVQNNHLRDELSFIPLQCSSIAWSELEEYVSSYLKDSIIQARREPFWKDPEGTHGSIAIRVRQDDSLGLIQADFLFDCQCGSAFILVVLNIIPGPNGFSWQFWAERKVNVESYFGPLLLRQVKETT